MVVQLQQIFSILSHHPVSGHKVASASFFLVPETPLLARRGNPPEYVPAISEGISNSGHQVPVHNVLDQPRLRRP